MAITKALTAAAVLLVTTALVPAFAHDDDHEDHRRSHRDLFEDHGRAHEEGFYSRAEPRDYHRSPRHLHEDFHEDHPGTWHDHYYGWRRYW